MNVISYVGQVDDDGCRKNECQTDWMIGSLESKKVQKYKSVETTTAGSSCLSAGWLELATGLQAQRSSCQRRRLASI